MAYNGSGTFSNSDTVTNATTVDATELNAIFQDLADGLTAAVAKDGQSTMTGALKHSDGSAAAPSITLGSDTNTGLYKKAADDLGVAVGGSLLANFNSSGLTLASGAFVGNVTGTLTGAWAYMPSGTKAVFQQTAAPTGWTKDTTHNNKALRVVSGTASSGGTVAFTTAFASQAVAGTVGDTTLTTDQIPAHTHTIQGIQGASAAAGNYTLVGYAATAFTSSSVGGGQSHTHTFTGTAINLAVQYMDVIVAVKD